MPSEKTEKIVSEPKGKVSISQYQEKPKRQFPLVWTVAGAVLFIGGIIGYKMTLKPHVDFGSTEVVVQLAKTAAEQQQGLSGRSSLPNNQGMLFVYNNDGKPGFWMKDMKFPLDFIWLKQDGAVAEVTPNVAPSTYPKTFYPDQPIRYVLEVNAGFAASHDIKQNTHANISL